MSTLLVGELAVGTPVMVHLGDAVRVLDPAEVEPLTRAIEAIGASLRGEDVDALFPDLVGREPPLPEHLRRKEGT